MTDTLPTLSVVLCTCPPAVASSLARALVEQHLVACVNILPSIQSVYRWDGAVVEDAESLLVMKVATSEMNALKKKLPSLHPYEVPELIALPVHDGLSPYIQWALRESTKPSRLT